MQIPLKLISLSGFFSAFLIITVHLCGLFICWQIMHQLPVYFLITFFNWMLIFGLKHAVDCQVSISNSDLHKAHYVCQTKFSAFCVFIIACQQKLSDENKLLNLILTKFLLVNSDHNKRRLKCLAVNFSPFRFSLTVRTRPKLQSWILLLAKYSHSLMKQN